MRWYWERNHKMHQLREIWCFIEQVSMLFCACLLCVAQFFCGAAFVDALRQKKRATGKPGPFISVKVKNLQRGTANAVEVGGKATMCISYERYGGLMCKQQPLFVHASYALSA
ncbi:hypothetical protein JOH51_002201 [Rhizobium leguminosarum]|nr:hypothetical protein [Rhizobium leguminosarum]